MGTSRELAEYLDNIKFVETSAEYCYICKKSIDNCKHSMFEGS